MSVFRAFFWFWAFWGTQRDGEAKTTNHGGEGTERRWQGSGPKARAATAEEGEARRVCHRMSAIFDGYEREYCDLSTQLGRKISQLGALAGDSRNQKARDITNDLSEADALIRRMDLEARSLPPDKKNPLLSKLREYKADLSKLKSDAKKSTSTNPDLSNRAELGLVGDSWSASSAAQRERLLQTTDRINRTGDNIRQSKQTLLETEVSVRKKRGRRRDPRGADVDLSPPNKKELGVSILQDLHRQRETITHARDTLHGVDDNILKSRKILSVMARRIMQNKAIMFGIIAMLVGSIGLVVYFKFIK